MCDVRIIYIVLEEDGVHALILKHLYIARLNLTVGHIEDLALVLLLALLKIVGKCDVLVIQILVDHIVLHLVVELFVSDTSELDERAYIIPVLLILLAVILAHACQLVGYLLGDVVRYLLYETVVLQSTSRYIKRDVRTVDHTL